MIWTISGNYSDIINIRLKLIVLYEIHTLNRESLTLGPATITSSGSKRSRRRRKLVVRPDDGSQPRLHSITPVLVYFRFTIHRNPIIVVNAFNSSATHRRAAVPIDALLIIGMTKAISDRLSNQRGRCRSICPFPSVQSS